MKTNPYTLAILVAGLSPLGCGSPGALGSSVTIHGTIDNWSAASGATVIASTLSVPLDRTPITTASIDADGNFSIALPNGDMLEPFLNAFAQPSATICSVQPTVDPLELKSADLLLWVKRDGLPDTDLTIASFSASGPPMAGGLGWNLLYADRGAHVSGQANCSTTSSSNVANYNLDLQKGWNSLTTHFDKYDISPTDGVDVVTETYAGLIPPSVKWQMVGTVAPTLK